MEDDERPIAHTVVGISRAAGDENVVAAENCDDRRESAREKRHSSSSSSCPEPWQAIYVRARYERECVNV